MKTLLLIVVVLMTSCSSTQFSNHKDKPSHKKYSNKRLPPYERQGKFVKVWVVAIGAIVGWAMYEEMESNRERKNR